MTHILLIHCGGTLGMIESECGYTTQSGNLRNIIKSSSSIASKCFCWKEENCKYCRRMNSEVDTFITPCLRNGKVGLVDIYEFSEIMDSSNASVKEWITIASTIEKFYDDYDGFIIVHGTDTLSYAASCVSFMIHGLTVPVVFTGSMLPMVVEGSDAEGNLIGAIESCMLIDFPGVYIFFNSWLHIAARTRKVSSTSFDSFFSTRPIKIDEVINKGKNCNISTSKSSENRPTFYMKMSEEIGIVKMFPGIHSDHLKKAFEIYKAVIIETYGTGTFPTSRTDLICIIKEYIRNGGAVVNVSQCLHGKVIPVYETSILESIGVISAMDMTTESAFAKLSFLVANRPDQVTEIFHVPFCGEFEESSKMKHVSFNK